MSQIKLRDYQAEAVAKFTEARAHTNDNRFLLTASVGAGKTIVASQIMSDEVRQRSGRSLFLCHRDELIRQTVDKLALVDDSLRVGVIQAQRDEWRDYDVVVASVQTIGTARRLSRIPDDYFSLVICDETHRATANSYRRVLERFGCYDPVRKTTLLGITATAKRTDGISLDNVYQRHVFDIGMLELIDKGALVPIKALTVETMTDLSGVKKRLGDFAENELASVLNTTNRNNLIAEAVQKYAADRKSLVFCVDIKHAEELAATMRRYGINTQAVHGKLSLPERRRILEEYAAGRIQALTTVQLLVEGYDEPSVNAVVWATQTMSAIKYTQGIGRGTRLSPETGKTDLLVIDCADNCGRHSLMSVPRLFDVGEAGRKALKDGKSVGEAKQADEDARRAAEEEAAKRAREMIAKGNGIQARTVDLFASPKDIPAAMKRSRFDWLAVSKHRFIVTLFEEQIHIRRYPSGGEYYVEVVDHKNNFITKKLLGLADSIEQAVNKADAYLSAKYSWMIPTMRKWEKEPPTIGQVNALQRFGDAIPNDKKTAFYAISLGMARSHYLRQYA